MREVREMPVMFRRRDPPWRPLAAVVLMGLTVPGQASADGEEGRRRGLLPTAAPVNIYTGETRSYWGVGYLQFSVTLPYTVTPEFTLGDDPDASFSIGDAQYDASGVAVAWGALQHSRSRERALIVGHIEGAMTSDQFTHEGVDFGTRFERAGFFVAGRSSTARRLTGSERVCLDWGLTSLLGLYRFSGNTRMASEPVIDDGDFSGYYISDYALTSTGLAFRPVLTLQPALHLTQRVTVIPFAGASPFFALNFGRWEMNEWEDVLYGQDCMDRSCDDSDVTLDALLEGFAGFDVELAITGRDRIAASSLVKVEDASDDRRISEFFVIYSRDR